MEMIYNNVLKQLLEFIPLDKVRTICHDCGKLGHKEKDVCCEISIKNFITDKNSIIQTMNNINSTISKCELCEKNIFEIRKDTNHVWKNKKVCDMCYSSFYRERYNLWKLAKKYKPYQCKICNSKQIYGEEYHYDHINMFDKNDSICNMIEEGRDINDIYKELDKCQVLCLTCHHKVTKFENDLGFTRIKQSLTRLFNNGLSLYEFEKSTQEYKKIYEKEMTKIYYLLRKSMIIKVNVYNICSVEKPNIQYGYLVNNEYLKNQIDSVILEQNNNINEAKKFLSKYYDSNENVSEKESLKPSEIYDYFCIVTKEDKRMSKNVFSKILKNIFENIPSSTHYKGNSFIYKLIKKPFVIEEEKVVQEHIIHETKNETKEIQEKIYEQESLKEDKKSCLSLLKAEQLKDLCRKNGIKGYSKFKKEQIIDLILRNNQ